MKLSLSEIKVLLEGLNAIGWDALPNDSEDKRAAQIVRRKLLDKQQELRTKSDAN